LIIDFDNNLLFKFIYAFHMPLFIFISGYMAYKQSPIKSVFLYNKFISLILPFLVWGLVKVIVFNPGSMPISFIKIIIYPDNGLWFLWSLFWINILFYISSKCSKNIGAFMFLLLLLCVIFIFFFQLDNKFGIKQTILLFPYFILGFTLKKYPFLKKKVLAYKHVYLLIFLLAIYFWKRVDPILVYQNYLLTNIFTLGVKTFISMVGVIAFFSISEQFNKNISFVQEIGKSTIGIYAIHFFILNYFVFLFKQVNSIILFYFLIILVSFSVLFVSYGITKILVSNKFSSIIFLGIRK